MTEAVRRPTTEEWDDAIGAIANEQRRCTFSPDPSVQWRAACLDAVIAWMQHAYAASEPSAEPNAEPCAYEPQSVGGGVP